MSAPVIQSTSPAAGEVDVVLGRPLEIVFDQAIDPASVSSQTFSLMGPGQTMVVDADELIHKSSSAKTSREYVTGKFTFPAPGTGDTWVQNQKLVFTMDRCLRPDVIYTALIVGKGSVLATAFLKNPAGEAMAKSLQFIFTTGELDLTSTPPKSPLLPSQPWEMPVLSPADILVRPRKPVGNDLTQVLEFIFPGPVDPASFDPNDIIVAAEPFLNHPDTDVPTSTAVVAVTGNKITVTVNWGADPDAQPSPPSPYPPAGTSGPDPNATDYGWTEPENDPFIRVS